MTPADLKALVRTIPDFPKKGIQFRDITTLLGNGRGFAASVEWLADEVRGAEAIAGMEARGFIFGAAVSARLGLPFLPIRKSGKLPCQVIGVDYELEYGLDRLEMDPHPFPMDSRWRSSTICSRRGVPLWLRPHCFARRVPGSAGRRL